ncbi:MAG: hypothetical protein MJZ97_12860, partial [Bacteroidales bacterium]|nr:hypothetical protein [Bacteroidales bacterium]
IRKSVKNQSLKCKSNMDFLRFSMRIFERFLRFSASRENILKADDRRTGVRDRLRLEIFGLTARNPYQKISQKSIIEVQKQHGFSKIFNADF